MINTRGMDQIDTEPNIANMVSKFGRTVSFLRPNISDGDNSKTHYKFSWAMQHNCLLKPDKMGATWEDVSEIKLSNFIPAI